MIDTLCVSIDFSTPPAKAWRTHRGRLIYSALIGVRDAKCIVVLDVVETRHELEWTIRAYRDSTLTDRPPSSGEQNAVRLLSQERAERTDAPSSRIDSFSQCRAISGRPDGAQRMFTDVRRDIECPELSRDAKTFIGTKRGISCERYANKRDRRSASSWRAPRIDAADAAGTVGVASPRGQGQPLVESWQVSMLAARGRRRAKISRHYSLCSTVNDPSKLSPRSCYPCNLIRWMPRICHYEAAR
jgi:hypothetical protein